MSGRTIAFALAMIASALPPEVAEPRQHVYRLVVTRCADAKGRYVQSAFKPAGIPALITALHGVAGCESITVFSSRGAPAFPGRTFRLGRADVPHDVVEVIAEPALPGEGGLPLAAREPIAGERLAVFGFPDGRTLSRGTGADVARPALSALSAWRFPPALRSAIEARRSPDIDIELVDIDGVLMPGHSGGPLLNEANQVVAVANGGLNLGTDHRTWATPWVRIRWQAFDEAAAKRLGRASELLFSYERDDDESPSAASSPLSVGSRTTATLEPNGQLAGLRGHLTTRLDGAGRAFLYARNIAIDGGQPLPVPVSPNRSLQLEDSFGQRIALTITAITPAGASVSYEVLPPNRRDELERYDISILDEAGKPVPLATVQVAFEDGTYRATLTNGQGHATFDRLKSRTAAVLVGHPGFMGATAAVKDAGQPLIVRLRAGPAVTVAGATEPGRRIVFIVDANGEFEPTVTDAIARVLDGSAGAFTSRFVTSGAFAAVFDGELGALPDQGLTSRAAEMLFGKSTVSYASSDQTFAGLRKAVLSVTLRRYRFLPQLQTDIRRFSAAGAGFSDADAFASASEHVASLLRADTR